MSDIGERVKAIVVEYLTVDPAEVVDGASFIDDLGVDSLDSVELAMILTVGDAVKFLEENANT
jgi:acyl carrier protein